MDALEAKIAAEPRSERNKALDEAVAIVSTVREDWEGPMWGGLRAIFDNVIERINALREV